MWLLGMGVYYYEFCTKLEYHRNFEIYLTISPNVQKTRKHST